MRQNPIRSLASPDRICGIAVTAVAVFLYKSAAGLPFGSLSAPDAGFFPKSLSVILALLGIGLLLKPQPTEQVHSTFSLRSSTVPIAAAALLAYAAFLDKIGFIIGTAALLFLLMTAYGRLRWVVALAVSVFAVTICYFGFTELGVPLPQGMLSMF